MKNIFTLLLMSLLIFVFSCQSDEEIKSEKFGIVIHGGAGTITPDNLPSEEADKYKAKLNEALSSGFEILKEGGSSLDAVEAAINILEDSPLFNAGKGAVFTADGYNELDASIMDGKTLNAGAVARVKHIKNPISTARLVMEKSKHVMLVGDGAETFARNNNVELVDTSYFFTQRRWDALQQLLKNRKERKSEDNQANLLENPDWKYGTVGAVALDKGGNLAAGTSTGGMTGKLYGRVGDSPIIGAGTYANNKTCAVSATGQGEYFIRLNIAHDISAQMEYEGKHIIDASSSVIYTKLENLGGTGGVICLDKNGNFAMPFNTEGMFRGYIMEDGNPVILMYKTKQQESN